jgi:hypothetical protein
MTKALPVVEGACDIDLRGGVPDLKAGKRIPIDIVAAKLGIERHGNMLRCWRPDNHQHGDRTPSVGIQRRANRVTCFVCDRRRLSTIDLVQSVLGCETFDAVLWLDLAFGPLPRIPNGKHLLRREQTSWRGPVGLAGRLEPLIRSGLFAELSNSQARLLVVLDIHCDPTTHECTISYTALRRFAGIAKDGTVSKALRGLERMHAIEIKRGRGGHGLSQCSTYKLTFEHTDFLALLQVCYERTRSEIVVQRKLRAERRKGLVIRKQSKADDITGINLSPSNGSRSESPTAIEWECEVVSPSNGGTP